jgi:hypothetical protein
MNDSRTRKPTGISRRALAKTLGGAAAAVMLPAAAAAAEEPVLPSQQSAEARIDALVEAALSATPARLAPEQRLEVRRAVRDTQKALLDIRKAGLGYDVDPATIFLAKPSTTP